MTHEVVATAIGQWHGGELYRRCYGSPRIVLGGPLWGEDYAWAFLNYSLASILSPKNAAALSSYGWEMHLYADETAADFIKDHVRGLPIYVLPLPGWILSMFNAYPDTENKYILLSAVHNILARAAGVSGSGFHMMTCDTIYSDGYFDALTRLAPHHKAIIHCGFTSDMDQTKRTLESYRTQQGRIAVSAKELGSLGYNLSTIKCVEVTAAERMPLAHYMYWRSRNACHLHFAHQSITWLSPEQCMRGINLGKSMDADLPAYIGREFYTPSLDDQMTWISLERGTRSCGYDNSQNWSRWFLNTIGDDFIPYFNADVPVPVDEDITAPTAETVRNGFAHFMDGVRR